MDDPHHSILLANVAGNTCHTLIHCWYIAHTLPVVRVLFTLIAGITRDISMYYLQFACMERVIYRIYLHFTRTSPHHICSVCVQKYNFDKNSNFQEMNVVSNSNCQKLQTVIEKRSKTANVWFSKYFKAVDKIFTWQWQNCNLQFDKIRRGFSTPTTLQFH